MDKPAGAEGPPPEKNRQPDRRQQVETLGAQGHSAADIALLLGISKQRVHQILRGRRQHSIRCRLCDAAVNPAGARPQDDRNVLCLDCLAKNPEATFGEHLKAFRLAAGMSVVVLAAKMGVSTVFISAFEEGRRISPAWPIIIQMFRNLGVRWARMAEERKEKEPR